ncbi:MAG: hypothetical protein HY720_15700 [Planctomycetes bacterium]|nr:hypothetical protein [Planctomycetota bacterium]
MVFTTNKPPASWARVLHDADLAEGIIHRVLVRGRFVELRGRSYRARQLPKTTEPGRALEPAKVSGIERPEFPEPTRRGELLETIEPYRSPTGARDSIVPWSGGKDSSSIAWPLKFEYGMNPLLVTFYPLLPNDVGNHNREQMLRAGFDHVFFRPNQRIHRTLENCQSLSAMLGPAHAIVAEPRHVVVAIGSRILVPFKKPLHYYLSTNSADTHAFRFSANALRGVLAVTGFETVEMNRFIDSEYLCAIGRRSDRSKEVPWQGDDPTAVAELFTRRHEGTRRFCASS